LGKVRSADRPPLIKVGPSRNLKAAMERAKVVLSSGGLVAYPTETFYGLAADATNEEAIRRLLKAKGRSADKPILVLIASVDALDLYADHIPHIAGPLIEAFWPGALTMVFWAMPGVSHLLTGGTNKIGIRISSHPLATALTKALGAPITGTSANASGKRACRSADEVMRSLGQGVDLILDGGETEGKMGSTLLDVTVSPPKILREGMVSKEILERFISNHLKDT
jgi:L-threonylcarbamoyladenylate synthase